jgi:hypothetical protein
MQDAISVDARRAVVSRWDDLEQDSMIQLSVVRGSYAMGRIARMSISIHSQSLRDTGRND